MQPEDNVQSFGSRLALFASGVGETLARTAASAGVLLSDSQLRKQGASVLSTGASRGFRNVHQGVSAGIYQLQSRQRQLREALVRLQQRTERERLAGLLRVGVFESSGSALTFSEVRIGIAATSTDRKPTLQEHRETPVDVQVGFQVHEDGPQELRSKLWMALLEHPEFSRQYTALLPEPGTAIGPGPEETEFQEPGLRADKEESEEAPVPAVVESDGLARQDSIFQDEHAERSSVSALSSAEDADVSLELRSSPKAILVADDPASLHNAPGDGSTQAAQSPPEHAEQVHCVDDQALDSSEHEAGSNAVATGLNSREVSAAAVMLDEIETEENNHDKTESGEAHNRAPGSPSTASITFTATPPASEPVSPQSPGVVRSTEEDEGWEVVGDRRPALEGATLLNPAACRAAAPRFSLEREAFRNSLMAAMLAVPWPLPLTYPPDCRYATLLQISIGQEDVDEVIARDIHRTFPEYALFGSEEGQSALFRVLKAYSLHDLEVGYCQGMAFVAGLLLFYLPEEPAFQLLCRLLAASGPNLRRFYLPGLLGLKADLLAFDALVQAHLPTLRSHLQARGVVPVLYASQWFLTAFACPMPPAFACRVLDGLLLENDSWVLARVALMLMAECEGDLLLRDDFEDVLTYLKLEPLNWPVHRQRRVLDAALSQARLLQRPEGYGEESDELDAGKQSLAVDEKLMPPAKGTGDRRGAEGAQAHKTTSEEGEMLAPAKASLRALSSDADTEHSQPGGVHLHSTDAVDDELARQRAELDAEFMGMVLELDALWAPDEDVAYDTHLGSSSVQLGERHASPE